MAAQFSPEDLSVYSPERMLMFPDAWSLTFAQLGVTAKDILEVNPSAQITRPDLIGYHCLQYGGAGERAVTEDLVEEAVDILYDEQMWDDWDLAQQTRAHLPRLLGSETSGIPLFRIRWGRIGEIVRQQADLSPLIRLFDVVTEPDASGHDVVSLYPNEGTALAYLGRVSSGLRDVILPTLERTDLSLHTDAVGVTDTRTGQSKTLLATFSNQAAFQGSRLMRLL